MRQKREVGFMENQNHEAYFLVKEKAHVDCDLSLIDSDQYTCNDDSNSLICTASCTTDSQQQGIMKKQCSCYTNYHFAVIYE